MNVRRLVNLLLFVLLAPMVGVEETCREIASGRRREDYDLLREYESYRIHRAFRRRSIETELLHASIYYESAGVHHSQFFDRLYSMLSNWFDYQKRMIPELYMGLLTAVIGLSLSTIVIIFLAGTNPMLLMTQISMIGIVPLLHAYQVECLYYYYRLPILFGAVASAIAYAITRDVLWTIIAFSLGFSSLYVPQLVNNVRLWLGVGFRVRTSFQSLLYSPSPDPLRPYTRLEAELSRLWSLGRQVGAPELVARIIILVDSLMHFVRTIQRSSMFYSLFIPIGYFITLIVVQAFSQISVPAEAGNVGAIMPIAMPSREFLRSVLLVSAVCTSLTFGKALHSVGLGVTLMPVFVAPLLFM